MPTRSVAPMNLDSMPIAARSREEAIQEDVEDELVGSSPIQDNPSDPDWTPSTRHLRNKLYAERETVSDPADKIPYVDWR
jgi:hypothetical protein